MRLIPLCVLFISALLITGCGQKKLSEEELLAALQSEGYTVVKEGRIHPSLEGALLAFWINIDGSRVAAYQYSTTAKAKLKLRTFQNPLCVGYWAFEFVDARTQEKIKKALE